MAEPEPTPRQRLRTIISEWGGIVSLLLLAANALLWLVGVMPTAIAIGLGGAFAMLGILGIVGHVFTSNAESIQSLGRLYSDVTVISERVVRLKPPGSAPQPDIEVKSQRSLSLEEIERHYELKKLEPNLQSTSVDPEVVAARFDDQGVIVIQPDPSAADTFRSYVVPITNAGPSRVGEAKKVRARISFRDFQQSQSGTVHRGAWLSEKDTEIDFPPNCSPRRLILITVEGDDPRLQVFSISRDFDSSYNGTITMREELHGAMYEFKVALFDERHATKPLKTFEYILDIAHLPEGAYSVTLSQAYFWKSRHLHEFTKQGFAFSARVHEIWQDANNQVPMDNTPTPTLFNVLSGEKPPEKITYFDSMARIRAIEREQEEKLIEEMKNWESRAADFIGRYLSTDWRDQFLKCMPSIEDGFQRAQKTFPFRIRPYPSNDEPPPLPYWTLRDAINSRTEKLMKISEHLK